MSKDIRDPKAEIYRIEELVVRVKDGDIKLPKFQRPFVWEKKDILRLLDSIYKGYPVGSVLLWLTNEKLSSEREIGGLKINQKDDKYPTNYLLDGQQRLSTLCGVLFWDDSDKTNSLWNVVFDLDKQIFLYPKDEWKPEYLRLNKLINTIDYVNQIAAFSGHKDKERFNQNATRLLNALKDYKLPAIRIGEMTIEEVAPIFERINSAGRQLMLVDLMRAATWGDGFDLNTVIENIREDIKDKEFQDVSEQHILRNIAASCGLGIYKEAIEKLREKTSIELQDAASNTREAYKLAVDFLTAEFPLTCYGYLPYGLQLTLLVEFFRINSKPDIHKREILKSWIWHTSFSKHFGRSNTGQQIRDLQEIRDLANNTSNTITNLEKIDYSSFAKDEFRLNKASSKAHSLLLAVNSPKSLLDGTAVNTKRVLSMVNKNEFHHIFPKEFLSSAGYRDADINQHANICMLTLIDNRKISNRKPSIYFKELQKTLGNKLEEVLISNYINTEAFNAALSDDYKKFISIRSELLISKIKELTPLKTNIDINNEVDASSDLDDES